MLRGRERHELACSSCGAPLHELKQIPARDKPDRERVRVVEVPVYKDKPSKPRKKYPKKPKKRKSWTKRLASEVFDVIEDIFD